MIDLAKLKAQLLTSGLQTTNNALYQVINQLLQAVRDLQSETNISINAVAGGVTGLENLDFLTHDNEAIALPNSRQLIAGTGVSFDDTVVNQRTIGVTVTSAEWSVLTDSNATEPELVFAGGDVIMTHIP